VAHWHQADERCNKKTCEAYSHTNLKILFSKLAASPFSEKSQNLARLSSSGTLFYRPVLPLIFYYRMCRLAVFLCSLLLLSCASKSPEESKPAPSGWTAENLPPGAYWNQAAARGREKILISLAEQKVALLRGGQVMGISPISSGREGHGTVQGSFAIKEKDENHRSSYYGAFVDQNDQVVQDDVDSRKDTPPPGTHFLGADMHWFMRINGAVGMHRGYLPGYPASHGCIRLPGVMAALFYSATPHGTPVLIQSNAGIADLNPSVPVNLPANLAETIPPPPPPAKVEKVKKKRFPSLKRQPKAIPGRLSSPGETLYLDDPRYPKAVPVE
jgi:L,D-transpeptidase catalytic domain